MQKIIYIFLFLCMPGLLSCEKLLIEKDAENTNENNFELLWTTIDEKYSFFEYKNIDWDSLYRIYRPKVTNSINREQLFSIMSEMLLHLRDSHVNLYSDFDKAKNWEWYSGYPENFNYDILVNSYFGESYKKTGPFETTVIDSIGYIYIMSFSEKVKEQDIDQVIDEFYDMKGIIVDVRNNSGGYSSGGKIITSRFADRKRLVSYTLYKSGPGHGDFTRPQPNYISPEGKKQFKNPVVVLANRRTYSATNDFVLIMSAFPHVTIIGDTTGGGGGTPYDYELLNGWRYRFPRTQTLGFNGFNVEHGIPPTYHINLSERDENRGIDTIIDAGLRYIKDRNANKQP